MYRRIFIPTKFLKGIPGGAMDEIGEPAVTRPMDALETVAVARRARSGCGLCPCCRRRGAAGVEFGNHNVVDYSPEKATDLSAILRDLPGLCSRRIRRLTRRSPARSWRFLMMSQLMV